MSNSNMDVITGGAAATRAGEEFDRTLRLLAQVEVPEGLAARVKARLHEAAGGNVIEWPRTVSTGGIWLRRAAAAAIAIAVGGGSWAIYSAANGALEAARKGAVPAVLPSRQQGDFGTAGSMKKANPLMAPRVKWGSENRTQGTGNSKQ